MLQFSKLADPNGPRLGNNLFGIAFLYSMANTYGVDWWIPAEWPYHKYFKNEFPKGNVKTTNIYKEKSYRHYDIHQDAKWWSEETITDIDGYFQHSEYWPNEKDIKELLSFHSLFKLGVEEKHIRLFDQQTIAIFVRRGDYIKNGGYHILSPSYYINALQTFDYERYNLVFISDDLEYCRFHFGCLPNAFFPETETDIEAMCLASLCDNFILANSTFGFWSAFLGEKEGTRVIRPTKLFAGRLLAKEGDHNFYLKRWESLDDAKCNLQDVTFTLPVMYDNKDRMENTELSICLLQKAFTTNIILGERGDDKKFEHFKQWCHYVHFNMEHFHRTRMLNKMAELADTPIICNYDVDVALPPAQIWQAVEALRKNRADMVYPYGHLFARIPRVFRKNIFPLYDLFPFRKIGKGVDTPENPSVGGAIFFNKQKFFEGGGENENFISYGPEDKERYERFKKLGYRIARIPGNLYHFDHYIGINSSTRNPFYNPGEYDKVKAMSKEELLEYVSKWEWKNKNNDYSDQYREDIDSRRSAEEIFKHIDLTDVESVIDFGCNTGAWLSVLPDTITKVGVDFGVPREKLLIQNYIDHDLRKPFPAHQLFDLVINVEVAEHLEERYADTLVDTLCNHAGGLILFSAACPGQGGLHHYNEKWASWWAEKFEKRGFYPSTLLREKISNNKNIDIWYCNNIIVYSRHKILTGELDYVHPELYENILKHHRILS